MLFNNTTSSNVTDVQYGESFTLSNTAKVLLYIGYGFIFASGTIGNSIVFFTTLCKSKGRRKSSDYQIISLSLADLLGSIFVPTVMIHDLITNLETWELAGNFGCKVFVSMNVLTTATSSWMMVAIAVARYR